MTPKKPFENIVGKGENAGDQHFLLFSQCFLPYQRQKSSFWATIILSSVNAFNLVTSKILSFDKDLRLQFISAWKLNIWKMGIAILVVAMYYTKPLTLFNISVITVGIYIKIDQDKLFFINRDANELRVDNHQNIFDTNMCLFTLNFYWTLCNRSPELAQACHALVYLQHRC